MKITLCSEVVRELPFEAQCSFAKSVGYDGLELAPCRLSKEPHLLPTARRVEMRRIAADHGIAITGLYCLMHAPANLSITAADPTVRARTLDVMERLCDLCASLGGKYLVHGSPDYRKLDAADLDGCRARGIEAFAHAAKFAAAAGVTYIVEPIRPSRTTFINTVAQAAEIVDSIGSPALKTMLDCCSGGEAETEPLVEVLNRWLPTGKIGHLHANDPNKRGPGEGDLRFGEIVATLKRSGYTGVIGVEPFIYDPDGPSCAARAVGYMRGLMENTL